MALTSLRMDSSLSSTDDDRLGSVSLVAWVEASASLRIGLERVVVYSGEQRQQWWWWLASFVVTMVVVVLVE
jgi:hypothetical protein